MKSCSKVSIMLFGTFNYAEAKRVNFIDIKKKPFGHLLFMKAVLLPQAEMLLTRNKLVLLIYFSQVIFTIWYQFTGDYIITYKVFPENLFQVSIC